MAKFVLIIKKSGLAIKLASKEFPLQKRGSVGIKATVLAKDDEIVAAVPVDD
jgi:hypothetical protein